MTAFITFSKKYRTYLLRLLPKHNRQTVAHKMFEEAIL